MPLFYNMNFLNYNLHMFSGQIPEHFQAASTPVLLSSFSFLLEEFFRAIALNEELLQLRQQIKEPEKENRRLKKKMILGSELFLQISFLLIYK